MKLQSSISFMLIIFIVFLGCDNSVESLEKGTCKVNVNGYISKSYSGQAIFDNVPSLHGVVFFLLLKDINLSDEKYRFVEFTGFKPGIGTYDLINVEEDNSSQNKLIGRYNDSENYGSYQSTGGRIGIAYASETEMKGWFDFPAYENVPINNGEFQRTEIRVSGEFYAEKGYTGIILD